MQYVNPVTELRQAKGWTQTQMAEFFGVNLSTVWRWENEGIPARGVTRKAIERELKLAQARQGISEPPAISLVPPPAGQLGAEVDEASAPFSSPRINT